MSTTETCGTSPKNQAQYYVCLDIWGKPGGP